MGCHKIKNCWSTESKIRRRINRIPGKYEILSLPITRYKVEAHPWVRDADIIHLHWIADFINYPVFFKSVNKPVVWTLHDYNPLCGIFHYPKDIETNKITFQAIDEKYSNIKQKSLSTFKGLTIVTPSVWLEKLSSNSSMLGKFSHQVIPNGIDTGTFKVFPKEIARNVFNLPNDKIILSYISEDIKATRKGFNLLVDAIRYLLPNKDIAVCATGRSNNLNIPEVGNLGYINDEHLMALVYATSDFFILPTMEDNLPNTMLESLSCGTPVISFNIGGDEGCNSE